MSWDSRPCLGIDTDIFFPEKGKTAAAAKKICKGCPVTRECLGLALASEEPWFRYGVFGGMSAFDRTVKFDGKKRTPSRNKNQCVNGHTYPAVVELDPAGRRRCPQCPVGGPRKTECKRKHPLTGDNLKKDGKCRACALIRQAEWKKRQAA